MVTGQVPHVGGPIVSGETTVLIGGSPAARIGDKLICVGPTDTLAQGEPSVLIGGKPASRLGDKTVHGGVVVAGCPTVIIGKPGQGKCLSDASAKGTPFIEKK
jgi:uncharacterized Zn-binding protein involved in type VI secretion